MSGKASVDITKKVLVDGIGADTSIFRQLPWVKRIACSGLRVGTFQKRRRHWEGATVAWGEKVDGSSRLDPLPFYCALGVDYSWTNKPLFFIDYQTVPFALPAGVAVAWLAYVSPSQASNGTCLRSENSHTNVNPPTIATRDSLLTLRSPGESLKAPLKGYCRYLFVNTDRKTSI